MTRKQAGKRTPLPANYQGAAPRQVAEALVRYRPGKEPRKPTRKTAPAKAKA